MDRTGTGTIAVFGRQLRFDLQKGFPLVTTKKMHTKSIFHELIWMISGSQNIRYLQDNGVTIWNKWADENGNLGPVYGSQWRHWDRFDWNGAEYDHNNASLFDTGWDQLAMVIEQLKVNPYSRRHLVNAWNVNDLPEMKLPPCHFAYQFFVRNGKLSCNVSMRSVDVFLGLPFDIASYATLTHMVARVTQLDVGDLIFSLGDTHIYNNHIEQVTLQVTRNPLKLPELDFIRPINNIDDFTYDDIRVLGYVCHPAIKGEISV